MSYSIDRDTQGRVTEYLTQNLSTFLEQFRKMIEVNSFTLNPDGVRDCGKLTASFFAPLGFETEYVAAEDPRYGDHVVLTRQGKTDARIGMVSHLDTVFPAEEELRNDFRWREVGDKIYGPGTIDIKGGTLQILMSLSALRAVAPELYDEVTWVVLLNAAEEHLVHDFSGLCEKRLLPTGRACLVFEAGHGTADEMQLVTCRKGRAEFLVEAFGRSSHAGAQHERGANAIVQLAEAITKIASFTDYERKLTFNPGILKGGETVNRVPHHASVHVEMRAFAPDVIESGVQSMQSLDSLATVASAADGFRTSVKVTVLARETGWPENDGTEWLFSVWERAGADLGIKMVREARGGLSDGNRIWQLIPTIDGLGPMGDNDHCAERSADGSKDQEYVLRSSIVPKGVLNCCGLIRLVEAVRSAP